jgi:mono/diheme cytochrome c family protein
MHAPVGTFEHRGKQYVIALSAGSALLGTARGDSVWLFGLDGTLPPALEGTPVSRLAPLPPAAAAAVPNAVTANITRGQQIYRQACALCHGDDGKGGHGVGAPLVGLRDLAATVQTVTAGRNSMPPFGSSLTPDEIRDVSAYVAGMSARPQ